MQLELEKSNLRIVGHCDRLVVTAILPARGKENIEIARTCLCMCVCICMSLHAFVQFTHKELIILGRSRF